ncbi:uncharacterized protein L201_004137 [Kwoniella dendrophila CBS 6074]|uniref:Major facilitator superfamily (MFS) profile domain-containing protein n=1 Tax=Kwoniella dendrophila CBS 6074 TaxID=1295534 RepID=A0AAX4JV86_9TREE
MSLEILPSPDQEHFPINSVYSTSSDTTIMANNHNCNYGNNGNRTIEEYDLHTLNGDNSENGHHKQERSDGSFLSMDGKTPKSSTSTMNNRRQSAILKHQHPLAKLSQVRKNCLLFIFSLASFIDICNVSGVLVAVPDISVDIKLGVTQAVWIITSYSLCFAAFLLFAGRLSDLFPAQFIFEAGFLLLGGVSLATSFVTASKFGFLVLRGIGGIFGAMTIPSAFNLTVHMFPDSEEQKNKLAFITLAAGLGNVLGLVIAGLCMQASYKWFSRLIAIICIIFAIGSIILLPMTGSSYANHRDPLPRWRRLDVPGVILMMEALICFILALTQGFFVWESRIAPKTAVLPSSIWKITNSIILSLAAMLAFPFWATSQLGYATWWQEVYGWSPLHVAVAVLPQGILCIAGAVFTQTVPAVLTKPRYTIFFGSALIIGAEVLQIFSEGGNGSDYWKFCFPSFIIGSFGAMLIYVACTINLITYGPPSMAGVFGAWTNVLAQVGGAITMAVQAGLQDTTNKPPKWSLSGSRTCYFLIGWVTVLAIQFLVFFKQPGTPEEEQELAMKRIMEADGDLGI